MLQVLLKQLMRYQKGFQKPKLFSALNDEFFRKKSYSRNFILFKPKPVVGTEVVVAGVAPKVDVVEPEVEEPPREKVGGFAAWAGVEASFGAPKLKVPDELFDPPPNENPPEA